MYLCIIGFDFHHRLPRRALHAAEVKGGMADTSKKNRYDVYIMLPYSDNNLPPRSISYIM